MGKITLTTIAEELVARNGVSRELADNFVHAIVETIEKGLREDGLVKIKGLGTFKLMEVSDRGSVDVNTGERITIKGYRKVSFTPDSAMKEFVNRPFAHFEPTELNEGYPAEEVRLEDVGGEDGVNETVDVAGLLESPVSSDCQSDKTDDEELKSSEENAATIGGIAVSEVDEVLEVESKAAVITGTEEVLVPMVNEESVEVEENEVPVTEEPVVTEEAVGIIEEAAVTEGEVVVAEETIEPKVSVSEEEKPSKRGGCGWIIVVLLIALTCGVYYFITIDQDALSDYEAKIEEYNDMMVNPNLEEELGEEWDEEPQNAPTPKMTPGIIKSQKQQAEVDSSEVSTVQSEQQNKVMPTDQESGSEKYCTVKLTELLEAKELKDITPADTTDYIIDGTLVTHELKSGETIILLARKYYGDKRLWPYIVKYNWMKDYNNVAVGQMINIPVLKDKSH